MFETASTGPDGRVAKSSANGLVGTVESRYTAALLEGEYEGAPSSVTQQIGPTSAQVSEND